MLQLGQLWSCPQILRPDWKGFPRANPLADWISSSVTKGKGFITLAPGPSRECPIRWSDGDGDASRRGTRCGSQTRRTCSCRDGPRRRAGPGDCPTTSGPWSAEKRETEAVLVWDRILIAIRLFSSGKEHVLKKLMILNYFLTKVGQKVCIG